MENSPIIFPLGKHHGKSIEWVLEHDPQYLEFIFKHSGCGSTIKDWIRSHWKEIEEGVKRYTGSN